MRMLLSVDRFEDDVAVLVTEDGSPFNVSRNTLPAAAKPGDVLSITIDIVLDVDAARALREETGKVEAELKSRDPGGDIKL